MRTLFEYHLAKDEYVEGIAVLTDQLGRQDKSRTPRIFEQLAVVLAVIAVIAAAFPAALLGLLAAAILLTVLLEALQPRWVRGATGQSYDPAVADHKVEITDDAIVVRSSLRERRWQWAAVRRIHDLKNSVVLELAGWDMIVLPNRLWPTADDRGAFVGEARVLATGAVPDDGPRKPASFGARDMLTIGALAAAVDILAVVVFALPAHNGPGLPISDTAFLVTYVVLLMAGLALAYFAFRIARRTLERLHDSSPGAAIAIAQMLIWAVPLYMLTAYLGWF